MINTRLLLIGFRAIGGLNQSKLPLRSFSTFYALRHSHSHDNDNDQHFKTDRQKSTTASMNSNTELGVNLNDYVHDHVHDQPQVHHYFEYSGKQIKKTGVSKNGKMIIDPEDDIVPTGNKANKTISGHSHGHSHADYPEMDKMDFNGEEFTIQINPKKDSTWSKVKDFFNPHTPISEVFGSNSSVSGHGDDHGHSHSHASDPEALKLYDTKNLANEGVKITWIGFSVNAGMAVTKFFGGIYFHSQALIADSIHAVGDLISDVLTLSTVRYTNKKPNAAYPLGYGKIETFGSFMVSFILLYAGFSIGWSSFYEIVAPIVPHAVQDMLALIPSHSHAHSHAGLDSTQATDINAAWLALGSIVVKEWLFRATKKVGEKMNSKVLIANAWHHRVDSLTSVVAVATISSGYFLNIYWMDCVGGLLVSMLIMKVGISGVVQSFKELIDKAMPKDDPKYTKLEDFINVQLMKKDSQILIKELNVLPSGTNMNVVLKLGVSSYNKDYENKLTLDKMGEIGESLKTHLEQEYSTVKNVSIQFVSNAESKESCDNDHSK
ncbi:Mmt1 protein [Martiniozyma asiatica (nom. inval.)]|nr:Mmt1 protein [Martiniozyma asiatica]